jgi:FixJ family two-component response regulator
MSETPSVLIIDDEEIIRDALDALLSAEGFSVRTAEDAREGLERLAAGRFDAVLLDLMLPDRNGLEVLEDIRQSDDELPVVMITAYGTIESAVSATKQGAFYYFTKPFKNDEVLAVLRNAVDHRRLARENRELRDQLRAGAHRFAEIIGGSQKMKAVYDLITRVTGTTANDVRVRSALQITRGRILINLNRHAEAVTAVTGVPTNYAYTMLHSQTTQSKSFWTLNVNARRYSVGNSEGTNGLNFATANDPRVPVCQGGTALCQTIGVTSAIRDDLTQPLHVFMLWAGRESPVPVLRGVDARMIEAEAQLKGGNAAAALGTLNAARTTVAGLTPLNDAGTDAARIDQLFRERAFWQFGRGYRTGDLRRLVRQYQRPANAVFPTGVWHKGGNYGSDVNVPVPFAEQNNPNVPAGTETCLNRNA